MLRVSLLARAAVYIAGVAALSLAFIASYAGALHAPTPHDVPVAVAADVPARLARAIDATSAFAVRRARDAADARAQVDRRRAYGAVTADPSGGLVLTVAPAAGPAVAEALRDGLAPRLGGDACVSAVHQLPRADARGLVGFYTVVGWIGALAVAGAGAVTVALQSVLGILGTAVAIFVFVVAGNPSSGGPFPAELLPQPWGAVSPAIPTGAATTALRDAAYFPDASLTGPLLVLAARTVAGVLVALLLGHRRGPRTRTEEEFALAGAFLP